MGNSASISNAAIDDSNNFNVSGPQPRAPGATRAIRAKFAVARDDFSNNNQKILDEFPELKDALEFIDTAMESMYESLPEDKQKNTMNLTTKQKMHEIMDFYFEHEKEEHRRLIGDELTNCNAGPLLVDYLKIITSNGHAYPEPNKYKFEVYQVLIAICWNYTDVSSKFSKQLCKNKIVNMMLETLKFFQEDFFHGARDFMTLAAMSVLHNCAETEENKKYFYEEPDMVLVVGWYTKNTSQEDNKVLALLSAITLAQIVDEKNNDIILADDTTIQPILHLLGEALEEQDHRADGFSAAELASGLTRLANNSENSVVIMKYGILKHLLVMLKEGDDNEKAVAAEAVWVLAFSDQNRNQIMADKKIMSVLKDIASSKTQNRKLEQAVSGALWVLMLEDDRAQKTTTTAIAKKKSMKKVAKFRAAPVPPDASIQSSLQPMEKMMDLDEVEDVLAGMPETEEVEKMKQIEMATDKSKGHIMISYQWDHQDLMVKIQRRLELDGFKVWIDLEKIGGSTLQAMAEAVEDSAVILIGLCRRYKESTNCRTEAEYAFKRQVAVIPLKVEDKYDPDGWLGAIIGTKFYFSFTGDYDFDQVYGKLIKEIGNRGKMVQNTNATELDASPPMQVNTVAVRGVDKPKEEIGSWTSSAVAVWAKQNGFNTLKTKNLDGEVLLFLRKMRHEAPEFFYRCATDQLGLKNVRDLMLFSKALINLQ